MMASAKACDAVYGADLPLTARMLREVPAGPRMIGPVGLKLVSAVTFSVAPLLRRAITWTCPDWPTLRVSEAGWKRMEAMGSVVPTTVICAVDWAPW